MTDGQFDHLEFNGWQAVRPLGGGVCGETYEIVRDDGFGVVEHGALKVLSVPHTAEEIDAMRADGRTDEDIRAELHGRVQQLARTLRALSAAGDERGILRCEDHAIRPKADGLGWDVYLRAELSTSLEAYLRSHTYGEAEVVRLGVCLCTALETCRARGVVHGDIKPENIFVSGGNFEGALDFRLGDFGMAPLAATNVSGDFAAPEVLCGESCTGAGDLYALGMVLYWMLNERRVPFVPLPPAAVSGSDLAIARDMRLRGDPLPPPVHGNPALQKVVLRACADHPAERYASPAELRAALTAAVHRPEAPPPPPRAVVEQEVEEQRVRRRKRPMVIAGAVVVLALVVLIIAMSLPGAGTAVADVALDRTSAELAPGDTLQLTATVTGTDGAVLADEDVHWTSGSHAVATVKDGLVTAVAEGSAKITAKAGSCTAECTVTVTEKAVEITSVTISRKNARLQVGDTLTLTAAVTPRTRRTAASPGSAATRPSPAWKRASSRRSPPAPPRSPPRPATFRQTARSPCRPRRKSAASRASRRTSSCTPSAVPPARRSRSSAPGWRPARSRRRPTRSTAASCRSARPRAAAAARPTRIPSSSSD